MNDYLIIKGSALDLRRLSDDSIDLCVTSPPYFSLRSYLADDDPLKQYEIGQEPTAEEFVETMVAVFRGIRRVLKPTGTLWLNLGDSYANDRKFGGKSGPKNGGSDLGGYVRTKKGTGLKEKDLIGIPYRVAMALQADGWYWRAIMPWLKANAMPESVCDRPHVAHESIMLFSKGPRYFYDADAIRRPSAQATLDRDRYSRITSGKDGAYSVQHDHETPSHALGRYRRTTDWYGESVDEAIAWHEAQAARLRRQRDQGGLMLDEAGDPLAFDVTTGNFPGAHFAVFPPKLIEPAIKAGTSGRGCCPTCGMPWVRVTKRTGMVVKRGPKSGQYGSQTTDRLSGTMVSPPTTTTLGWQPSCVCPAHEPIPCTVLDPFGGAGTTTLVANALGRRAIAVELDQKSIDIACKRLDRPHASLAAPTTTPAEEKPNDGPWLFH